VNGKIIAALVVWLSAGLVFGLAVYSLVPRQTPEPRPAAIRQARSCSDLASYSQWMFEEKCEVSQ
jgi:hypothetical protein